MGFSATSRLLLGSMQRPDIITVLSVKPGLVNSSFKIGSTPRKLNILGYIPGASTITGLGRALLGVVHTIVHLAFSIFNEHRAYHLEEAKLGAKNIARELIEAIPVIGNITMFLVDMRRLVKCEKMIKEQIHKNESNYSNHSVLFFDGKEIAKRPIDECEFEMEKLNRRSIKPTLFDLERIIRRGVLPA